MMCCCWNAVLAVFSKRKLDQKYVSSDDEVRKRASPVPSLSRDVDAGAAAENQVFISQPRKSRPVETADVALEAHTNEAYVPDVIAANVSSMYSTSLNNLTNVEINYVYRLSPDALAALANHLNQEESLQRSARSVSAVEQRPRIAESARANLSLPIDESAQRAASPAVPSSPSPVSSMRNAMSVSGSSGGLASPSMHSAISNYQIVYDENVAL